jgi:hypothetical protein
MRGHTTTNNNTVSGGDVKTRFDHGGAYEETISRHLGQQLRRQKIKKIKLNMVFWGD